MEIFMRFLKLFTMKLYKIHWQDVIKSSRCYNGFAASTAKVKAQQFLYFCLFLAYICLSLAPFLLHLFSVRHHLFDC